MSRRYLYKAEDNGQRFRVNLAKKDRILNYM